jgi:zinc transporter ZupT
MSTGNGGSSASGPTVASLSALIAVLLGVVGAALLRLSAAWMERVDVRAVHELAQLVTAGVVLTLLWTMWAVPIGVVTVHLMLCAALVLWSGVCMATVLFHRHEHQL